MASGVNGNVEEMSNEGDETRFYQTNVSRLTVHECMLKDVPRTTTYREAILNNPHLFRGKTVLDVGCGTGIMSMFAAKAGATTVIGVDPSDIIEVTRAVVQKNRLQNVITLIQGKVQEVELPLGIDKVDIIITSEWAGYTIFHEATLDAILFARDKWLKPTGHLFPDKVRLYMMGVESMDIKKYRKDFWTNVYGYDMSEFGKIAGRKPFMLHVPRESVTTSTNELIELDLKRMTKKEEANFSVPFRMMVTKNDYLNAFATFFEVEFSATYNKIKFRTSPHDLPTIWKQTVFLMDAFMAVDTGEMVEGQFDLRQNTRHKRALDITIGVDFDGRHTKTKENNLYKFR